MTLVSVGPFARPLLQRLSRATGIPLGLSAVDPSVAWNDGRRQYNSNRLLLAMKDCYSGTVIAATTCDLYIPVLTFVFGEAELSGRVAIFSTHRLHEEFYGLPPDPELLFHRSLRELWHEFGHLLGLTHCRDSYCVMSSSHSVEQVDVKGAGYCAVCLNKVSTTRERGFVARLPKYS